MFKLRNLVLLLVILSIASPALAQTSTESPTEQATQPALEYTLNLSSSKDLGAFIVGPNGMTLYTFDLDTINNSACVDKCATFWPPLTVASADKVTADEDIHGAVSTITRKDGTMQVTYNGQPLYYWAKDKVPGDTTGNRVGRTWWIARAATVSAVRLPKSGDNAIGNVLVGEKGMTLYIYTKDTPGTSTCYDKCATAWPPLTVTSADEIVPGVNLPGKFDTTKRTDGTLQVTYNGWPLYYWAKDKVIGDATGEAVGKVWYTVVPETVVPNSNGVLTTTDGMTVYTFAKDTAGVSTCTGDCSKNWPAYTIQPGDRVAAPAGVKGKLATITRDDKSIQVTYNGMPLYLYAKDTKPGDTTGDKVGNVWSVVKP